MAISKITSNSIDFSVGTSWQAVKTTNFTAVAGEGYFVDTTSGAITVTLPSSPTIGDEVTIADYATTFATNNVTINPNGNKIESSTENGILSTNDQTHTLVYTDSTQGWKIINQDTASNIQPTFISATGGTVTESGDYKIHTFTGDGCFVVSTTGTQGNPNTVDYLVVAGGGSGGPTTHGGGGGAGGFREGKQACGSPHTASPLATTTGITVTATTYPITVGAGGTGGAGPSYTSGQIGNNGSNSVFSTITSTGGGGGGAYIQSPSTNAKSGGSGGGGAGNNADPGLPGGSGNTPPVSPPQGNNGGTGSYGAPHYGSGGGGGATATGGNGTPSIGANGGAGATTSISGTPTTYGGGGGGSGYRACSGQPTSVSGTGGTGGGGNGSHQQGGAGTANTGGGGGGSERVSDSAPERDESIAGGAGGSGVVILRYKYQ